MTVMCRLQSNCKIIHHLQWLLLTLPQMGHRPEYLRWFWLTSHHLPHSLHTPYLKFPHREWVEPQESVTLVACALSNTRIHAYDHSLRFYWENKYHKQSIRDRLGSLRLGNNNHKVDVWIRFLEQDYWWSQDATDFQPTYPLFSPTFSRGWFSQSSLAYNG